VLLRIMAYTSSSFPIFFCSIEEDLEALVKFLLFFIHWLCLIGLDFTSNVGSERPPRAYAACLVQIGYGVAVVCGLGLGPCLLFFLEKNSFFLCLLAIWLTVQSLQIFLHFILQ